MKLWVEKPLRYGLLRSINVYYGSWTFCTVPGNTTSYDSRVIERGYKRARNRAKLIVAAIQKLTPVEVYADYLEERGFDEAAAVLRKFNDD